MSLTENPRVGGSNPPLGTTLLISNQCLEDEWRGAANARVHVVGNILGNS